MLALSFFFVWGGAWKCRDTFCAATLWFIGDEQACFISVSRGGRAHYM